MKKNKKGFVLAETIVVGVFLISLISILILNVLPLIGDYERISTYDNLDRKYDVNLIRKMLLLDESNNGGQLILAKSELTTSSTVGYLKYPSTSQTTAVEICNYVYKYNTYCKNLLGSNYLDVKTIIISTYDITKLKTAIDTNNLSVSRGLKEYLAYLSPNLTNATSNYKRIIVEFTDNTYANIEVPYE